MATLFQKLKSTRSQSPKIKTNFQFRHLNYLAMPESVKLILHRRVHFLSLVSFLLYIIVDSLFFPDMYTYVDTLIN